MCWKVMLMPIKIGHSSIDENGKAVGGNAGDQTKKEVCIRNYYDGKWNRILRPKNSSLADKSALAVEQACGNDKIGYDQRQRNTLYNQALKVDFDLSKIKVPCECDCSSLIHVAVIAGGANVSYGSNGFTTRTMADRLLASKEYEELPSAKNLKRGDILVREGKHTVMVLEGEVETVDVAVEVLRKGTKSDSVKTLQILLNGYGYSCGDVDGSFGSKTLAAVQKYQKANKLSVDGVVGKKTWTVLLQGGN